MALKVQNAGLFTIPTGPSVGTVVAQSGSANTYGSFVTLQASGALGASYLTGISATNVSSLNTGQYVNVQVATGASGSESVVGAVQIPTPGPVAATGVRFGGFASFADLPIAIAANTRISCKTASDTASGLSWNVSLQGLLQANGAVDTGLNENVNVINVNGTAQTARDLGASVLLSSGTGTGQIILNSGTVTVGTNNDKTAYSLSQSFPSNFATLSIDSSGRVDVVKINGTSQTARDLGASVLVSSGTGTGQLSLTSGAVTVSSGTVTSVSSNISGSVASVTGLTASNLDTTISSRMASYTQPTGFLAATFPSGTIANTTNITSGTIATVSGNVTGSVGSVTGLTASNLDTTISSRMASYTQPTGFLAATFPSGTIANTTNITSGTINTVSGNVTGSVGSVTGLTASNLDTTVSSRLSSTAYTAPDNASVTSIKTQTDKLTFTVANKLDSNVHVVNGITVTGTGASSTPWGP